MAIKDFPIFIKGHIFHVTHDTSHLAIPKRYILCHTNRACSLHLYVYTARGSHDRKCSPKNILSIIQDLKYYVVRSGNAKTKKDKKKQANQNNKKRKTPKT